MAFDYVARSKMLNIRCRNRKEPDRLRSTFEKDPFDSKRIRQKLPRNGSRD